MAQLQNGREESQLNNGVEADDSLDQLAGRKVIGEHFNSNNNTEPEPQDNGESSEPLYTNHFFVNGTAPTESELLQHISDAISNFSLNPRPTSELFSTPQATPPPHRLPAVAPKPSTSKNPQPNHQQRVRGKSASQMGYQFHVNENATKEVGSHPQGAEAQGDGENRTLRFVGKRGLTTGDGDDITSAKGTVRGVTNRVRAGIMNFNYKPLSNAKKAVNNDDERDKIIVYTTSMRIVRQTFEDCQFVRKLFQNHRVRFEERDLFMNSQHQQELIDRLEDTQQVTLPIVFIDGELVGDVETLEELNETGQLRRILERFEKFVPTSDCRECGGFRYVPCRVCSGSKKSLNRNNFTDQFHALRCSYCDENGLQKCSLCNK
ncbi:glutaredoxin domain-containing cysteine-rich protein 1-like [Asterias amurensis]|uniref:glutaredoxin domain-containing cysteine-rich protein 1-like n=1 Tax=Asterias amurensis TaxID=7602 RepID=UPI003AB6E58A